jgi:hypothetical protein
MVGWRMRKEIVNSYSLMDVSIGAIARTSGLGRSRVRPGARDVAFACFRPAHPLDGLCTEAERTVGLPFPATAVRNGGYRRGVSNDASHRGDCLRHRTVRGPVPRSL